ncbi:MULTISPECIES: invasion associated locus B family protein [unclassified Beijerinckia]|uniref:invasion associated locus B family protein n=1 Tax=unclassified Beijerinckia TaxID=2638183 RepID=UPI00089C9214|nr:MULTISPECIES: invasion associated locus B family protein [unclassified Beijerinckia]MDH7794013.1 invasion protein IalB [Beijerinckia sp. GAS462]SEB51372.1 Invasion protein IalB, involved in pathogenesis [Beijerinckia sp. 28-YEA-48]
MNGHDLLNLNAPCANEKGFLTMNNNIRRFGLSTAAALAVGMLAALVPGSVLAQATSGAGAAAVASLPGGASSLNETYKDWRVACAQQANSKRCVLSQVQAQQNGQRVLAMELDAPSGNTVAGALILPFGLALDSGVTFQIDEKPAMQPVRFRTCVPGGCVVAVSFDAPTLAALRAGSALKVKAVADGGTATPFSISLQGFGTALDRVGALSR